MNKINRLLLVDDDEISNFINERKIRGAAIADKINVCDGGATALKLLNQIIEKQEEKPIVILLDINMPVMDGFGFLEEFVKLPASFIEGIRIAMLTSSLEKDEVKRSYEYKNVVDFINKPLSTDKIKALLNKLK